jgi:hypothetical protein
MKKFAFLVFVLSISVFAAGNLKIECGIVHLDGSEYTAEELSNITLKAWISNYSQSYISNVTTEADSGNAVSNIYEIRATCGIDFINFTDWNWREGDVFHLLINDYNYFDDGSFSQAYTTWTVPEYYQASYLLGFEDYIGEGGFPLNSWQFYQIKTDVYVGVVDSNGEIFDFNSNPYDNVTFQCWLSGREDDIIEQNSVISPYYMYGSTASAIHIQRSDFEKGWISGDTLNVSLRQHFYGQGYYFGEKQFVFTTTHSSSHYVENYINFGLDVLYGEEGMGGGDPVKLDNWVVDTGVEEFNAAPLTITLSQNYPNPFNPETLISFSLPEEEQVKLSVFNSEGQLVKELVNGKKSAGNHNINFNAADFNSGIYFYTFEAGKTKLSQKMLFVK